MGINTRGMFQALGNGIADYGGLLMQESVAQKREARMAALQQKRDDQQFERQGLLNNQQLAGQMVRDERGFAQQSEMQEDAQGHQTGLAREQAAAAGAAAERERAQAEIDRIQKIKDEKELIEFKGQKNPDAPAKESAMEKAIGGGQGALYNTLQEQANSAGMISHKIDVFEKILEKHKTGKWAQAQAAIESYFPSATGGTELQVIGAIANELALAKTKFLPGSIAAQELEFLKKASGGVALNPGANRVILGMLRRDNQNYIDAFNEADEIYQRDGNLDGFINTTSATGNAPALAGTSMEAADDPLNGMNPDFDGFNKFRSSR